MNISIRGERQDKGESEYYELVVYSKERLRLKIIMEIPYFLRVLGIFDSSAHYWLKWRRK
jgi:hypothetical protein